jgi:dolichol-phosphate mannosyltransferase
MLSIVIPTLNEEESIKKTLDVLSALFKKIRHQIIVVDDLSTDKTTQIIQKHKSNRNILLISNNKFLGLGYALNLGFLRSKYSYVMFLDADLSIGKIDILRLFNQKKKNSIVIGSRYSIFSKVIGASTFKIKSSKFLNYIISKIFKLEVVDISHSFRIICKNVPLISKNTTHPGFFWETTINAKKLGYTIKEIPITFIDRKFGYSKNKILKMILSVIFTIKNLRDV